MIIKYAPNAGGYVKKLAKKLDDAIVATLKKRGKEFMPFTRNNFRGNLEILTGKAPCGAQAHHIFPQADEFTEFFKGKIDIHNPVFGSWWEATAHNKKKDEWNGAWRVFMKNNPKATADDMLKFGKTLAKEHGLEVYFK